MSDRSLHHCPILREQVTLASRPPLQAMTDWYKLRYELLNKQPHYRLEAND
jgi:hypothetical protein